MKRYQVTLTIDTVSNHPNHVLNRVKKSLREYGMGGTRMEVVDCDCQAVKSPPVEVTIGAVFRMDGGQYLLSQVGTAHFSLIHIGSGQRWSGIRNTVQAVLNKMQDDTNGWELVAQGESAYVTTVLKHQRGLWNKED